MGLTIKFLLAGGTALVAAVALVPLLSKVAFGYGVISRPTPDRLHHSATPYLGGVAIVIAACGAAPFLHGWRPEATVVLLAAAAIGVIGLVDDVRTVPPIQRVAIEAVAAAVAAAAGARVHLTDTPIDWLITIVWIVGVTNAYNLLDNMDGAAGVIASITGVALAVAAGLQGQILVGGLAAVVAGACIGFLVYNWHPARIFMGDAGSLFIGFLLAVIALELRFPVDTHAASVSAVLLLTGPALFDTVLVVVSRRRAGVPVYKGGVDHTSHRLLAMGFRPASVVGLLGLASAACCTLGIVVGRGVAPAAPVITGALVLGLGLLALMLRLQPGAAPVQQQAPPSLLPSAAGR
jgi:UDP-GlcNAc:undecaprenyl-phosphate GlcNAc-1-phosphate transferase